MSTPQLDLAQFMRSCAQDAVNVARTAFGTDLDFSPESIAVLESLLAPMGKDLPAGFEGRPADDPLRQQVEQLCLFFGAYLGEVARTRFGGEWVQQTEPAPMLCLRLKGITLYPPTKVWKRMVGGEGENIAAYWQTLQEHMEKQSVR